MPDTKLARFATGHPAYQLVRLIGLRGTRSSGWYVLVEAADSRAFEDALTEELRIQMQVGLRIIDAAKFDVSQLLEALRQPHDDIVLVQGMERWSDRKIEILDANRSAMARPGFVIIWLPDRGVSRLLEHAPNLLSWVGGNIFRLEPDGDVMSDIDRRTRLKALSEHYGLTDEQVIQRAQSGTLPLDPEFAEWLVLIGRGDLAG